MVVSFTWAIKFRFNHVEEHLWISLIPDDIKECISNLMLLPPIMIRINWIFGVILYPKHLLNIAQWICQIALRYLMDEENCKGCFLRNIDRKSLLLGSFYFIFMAQYLRSNVL